LESNRLFKLIVLSVFLLFCFPSKGIAQETGSDKPISADSILIKPILAQQDTLPPLAVGDSISIGELKAELDSANIGLSADTLVTDSIPQQPIGDIKTIVKYSSKDSMTINMITKDVKMYGTAKIEYTPISIAAEEVTVNWQESLMKAEGIVDSTGNKIGTPIFVNGASTYQTDQIQYNFKTEKASITGLVTTQGEGYIHADKVFKNAKGELFNQTTHYTTCNLAHPHYSIKARKVKIIPGKEMISGPFNMVINDVPLPLGFIFGMFPDQQERNSGVIVPTFGEETRRGFFLREGGYYFAFNDYLNLELTGDIYTKGGWAVKAASLYKKRYRYSGNILFNTTKLITEDEGTLDKTVSSDYRFSWSHNPISRGTGRFSASVNIASSTYNLNNALPDQNDQIKANLSSSVNYSKSFAGTPFSIGLSGRFNQNLSTEVADILLPDFNFNVQNIYPFKKKGSSGRAWYEKINFRYTMVATNKITNRIRTVDGDSIYDLNSETLPFLFSQASNGFNHTIPISTSLKLLKHFKINPSFNYQETWYFKKLDYKYDQTTKSVVTDTLRGFNALRSYQAAIGLSSVVYGTVFTDREFGVQAVRHQLIPALSYSYRPDFGDPKFDYFQEVQVDSLGNTNTFARYTGFVYGQPRSGESSSIGLSLTNTLEMKYRNKEDTTGKAEKIILLRNFGLSTSYNMLADSFKLSPISLNATTNLLNNKSLGKGATTTGINLNFRGTIDPYLYVLDSSTTNELGEITVYQRRLNQFKFSNGQGLGQFSSFTVALSTGFRAKTRGSAQGERGSGNIDATPTNSVKEEQDLNEFQENPDLYIDFKIPWSINFSYNVNFARAGFNESKVTQSLRFNGDLSLTPKWKVTFNSGYDFERKKFNETRLGITRDLHCWEMRLDWVPYGRYQSYNFTIRAKSSLLQDLKISKRRNATDSFSFQ